jgi:hypothetical protein
VGVEELENLLRHAPAASPRQERPA